MTLPAHSPRRPASATTAQPRTATLAATHRCTRCGSQAFTVYEKAALTERPDTSTGTDGEASVEVLSLLLCAHHSRAHHDALLAQGFVVSVDETWRLTPNTPSS